ncbi:hypothetical protein BDF22DRAFT_744336 [Syncephalis plumigaleata]|nr:hypothetical protein BDF22DRAFT_744336 [Syncephalis plumigaleata]
MPLFIARHSRWRPSHPTMNDDNDNNVNETAVRVLVDRRNIGSSNASFIGHANTSSREEDYDSSYSSDSSSSASFPSSWISRRQRRQRQINRVQNGEPIGRGERHVCAPLSRWEEKLRGERRQTIRLQQLLFCLAAILTLYHCFCSFLWHNHSGPLPLLISFSLLHLQIKLQRITQRQKRAYALRHVFRRHPHLARQEHLYPPWMSAEMNGNSGGLYYNQSMRCLQLHLRSDDLEGPDPNAVAPELLVMPPPAYLLATREPPAYVQELNKPPRYNTTMSTSNLDPLACEMAEDNRHADHTIIIQSARI